MSDKMTGGAIPLWIRMPTRGQCPYTGLTRSYLYQLIGQGVARTASLKRPGCKTGVRLISGPDVLAYIEAHVERRAAS